MTSGIDHLLKALWHSEFLCRFALYRTGIILLADISLEFGMSKRSRQILEEVMPQVCTHFVSWAPVLKTYIPDNCGW